MSYGKRENVISEWKPHHQASNMHLHIGLAQQPLAREMGLIAGAGAGSRDYRSPEGPYCFQAGVGGPVAHSGEHQAFRGSSVAMPAASSWWWWWCAKRSGLAWADGTYLALTGSRRSSLELN